MKIKKSELKELIREALREELANKQLKRLNESLESDIIAEFECEECGYVFSERYAYDYFEDEVDLESVVETGDMDCPECGGHAICGGYSYVNSIKEQSNTLPNNAYVLKAKDAAGEGFLNINLSSGVADFDFVDSLPELTETSYSSAEDEAIAYADEAFNLTMRDWDGAVSVLKISNFKDAYLGNTAPRYTEIYTKSSN